MTFETIRKAWGNYCVVGEGWSKNFLQVSPASGAHIENNKINTIHIRNYDGENEFDVKLVLHNTENGFNVLLKMLEAIGLY